MKFYLVCPLKGMSRHKQYVNIKHASPSRNNGCKNSLMELIKSVMRKFGIPLANVLAITTTRVVNIFCCFFVHTILETSDWKKHIVGVFVNI